MAITRIDIATFLKLARQHPVIDVRSEGEFNHAHFPGAFSMPLFNNEERKVVGTAYKQESQQQAIKIGLQYFGPKLVPMVEQVEALLAQQNQTQEKAVIVYCWRGGMRSGGVGWLLDLYGFKVYTLAGGYKAFRRWGIQQLEKDHPLKLIGGYTGSGKTEVLDALRKKGEEVIDLEGLAHHKGSAFGNIGMPPQPSQEMFENKLALALWQATGSEEKPRPQIVWLEDESQRIGTVNIPAPFFRMMQQKPVCFMEVSFEERLRHIVAEYGKLEKERLVNAIIRIQKRLGGLDTKLAINYLIEGNITESFRILLQYYDKQYSKSLQLRMGKEASFHTLNCAGVDATENAGLILAQQKSEIHV